jgi:hypothetical protein
MLASVPVQLFGFPTSIWPSFFVFTDTDTDTASPIPLGFPTVSGNVLPA